MPYIKSSDGADAHILVVDDERHINDLIREWLAMNGYDAEAALTGEEALAILKGQVPQIEQHFDLVLLDIMLPGIDGYEVCRRLKADAATADVSVIMLTAMGKIADKVRGLELGADDYIPKPFDNLELLARVRATLRLRKAEQDLRRRNQALDALNAVAEAVGNAVELVDVVDTALNTVLQKLDLLAGAITLGSLADQQAIVAHKQNSLEAATILDVAGRVIRLDQPYALAAGSGEKAFHVACVPLRAHNRLSGTLLVANKLPIDADLLEVLGGIGMTLGAAVERARLYEAAQQRSEEFAVLNDLSRIISSTLDLEGVFTGAVRGIREFMRVEIGALVLKEEQDDSLTFRKILSRDQEWTVDAPLLVEDYPLIHQVVHNLDMQVVETYSAPASNPLDAVTGIPTRNRMCVPLIVKGRCIGAIEMINKIEGTFTGTDAEMAQFLAASVAVALENARLYTELAASTRDLERSQAQLIQAEKLAALGRMAASIAHEVNNPLQAIQNCLHLVINRPLTEDKRAYYLQMAQEEVQRLITIVTRTLDFYRPSKGRTAPIQINHVVESVLALAGKRLEQGKVRVSRRLAAELPQIAVVPDQVTQVFLNLVINAVEAMPDGGTLTIGTTLDREGYVRVSFTDSGQGLKPEDVDKLFEPFFTTKVAGTGLGLAVSHNIVERHGGHILVDSAPGQGASFTVVLPIEDPRQEI
ncbi:MAG: response regulator [Thermoflexales bacterium]|nr:response regulator [Thermoflexales bacterium]